MTPRRVLQAMHIYLHKTRIYHFPQNGLPAALLKISCLRFCTAIQNDPTKSTKRPENRILLNNLSFLGVDIKMARKRQPGVLRRETTNEKGLVQFLRNKGADHKTIASIISRYPRAITRSICHLEERWQLWRNIFKVDSDIIKIVERSPESYFRSSDNENLEKNINFLCSLGLTAKDLHRMFTTAPRTFSNSLELNKQMVEFLQELCVCLGGDDPNDFVKRIITKNVYILIRSTKRVKSNIEFLKESLKLTNDTILKLLQGQGADLLDLSNHYITVNFNNAAKKLRLLDCTDEEIRKFFTTYPPGLYVSSDNLSNKIDCLLEDTICIEQILKSPRVLECSVATLKSRLNKLAKVRYNFEDQGISILEYSRKRFEAKLEKLNEEL
ncbi:transcription termination factor 1, mitochondrial [Callorhinchus milii]|uniref:Mitochondrial transcription termination factor 1 n=1 Tax=Callorhinchus milii TaxID=7868 RepID=A0A4W3KEF6_CALMI|nr:transcription termination factor 1, mitochondrial [Callorhinchus milii]XP_007895729.1 transcription termination factor 1, mitochondrial [Callorhinchus milii]XP_007895730.1 transcription termination factor 1, mitochondrial [Callorhinchus milii]XP_042188327.1 transcription termination factor 1, mitochondrial [Callorhinchus milii]|eukprot:gi/632959616/ref/XP_007895727.1/ PREDICTED: transcription termination factor, mitochondrial [Callorhinchus milii]